MRETGPGEQGGLSLQEVEQGRQGEFSLQKVDGESGILGVCCRFSRGQPEGVYQSGSGFRGSKV